VGWRKFVVPPFGGEPAFRVFHLRRLVAKGFEPFAVSAHPVDDRLWFMSRSDSAAEVSHCRRLAALDRTEHPKFIEAIGLFRRPLSGRCVSTFSFYSILFYSRGSNWLR